MFLFKQKTAYEMRISDWSSDVCASDLGESELMDKEEAYKIIEYHYRNNFKNLISRYSRQFQSHSRAEDIVQEAYTRALQYWNRYSPEQPFGAWFNGILLNCVKDNIREEAHQGAVEYPPEEEQTYRANAIPAIMLTQEIGREHV